MARMARVRGRFDDMLIIRGVNLYPSEVERVLLGVRGVAPHYQLVVERPGTMDELTVVPDSWNAMAMRGTGSVSVKLIEDEVFVPDYRGVVFADILAGSIENDLAGSLWKAPTLGWSFALMAGMSIGIAQGALERFIERERRQNGGEPFREHRFAGAGRAD